MSNPVFDNSVIFGDPRKQRRAQGGAAPTVLRGYPQAGTSGAPTIDALTLEQMYGSPTATTRDTGRLTYDDVIVKTGGLLALLVVVAAATWQLAPGLWILGAIVGLGLGLVNAFKKSPSPALITAYVVAQGVFLGGISAFYAQAFRPGVVPQAVLATFAVFAVALFLFRSGRVRVTPKFTKFLLLAMGGYLVFSLLNFALSFALPSSGMFGPLRGGLLGVVVGLVAVGLAAASLIVDFDSIKRGVEQGVPAKFAWSAAFGLIVTLVWLYLELLRLAAMFSGRS
ncbi:MAG: Bax inhibitor-1/YccA family membrane protein [Cellulomonas sp.]